MQVPLPLPNITSLQEQKKNKESALSAVAEKAENWLHFKDMNIF